MVLLQTTPSFHGSVQNYKLWKWGCLCSSLDQVSSFGSTFQTKGQDYYVEEGGPLHFQGAMESWVARTTGISSVSTLPSSSLRSQMSLLPSAKPRILSPSWPSANFALCYMMALSIIASRKF